ncbi:cytochrome P450 alkane hydroxylase-like protein [Phaeosphaeria sp. MPI-PUGE-AT-0046c]|nr:cytochrome P450 alkane hydroxylase-like protein [Phaeosphaeria sp. MPI-PUGE-AT-0046c]
MAQLLENMLSLTFTTCLAALTLFAIYIYRLLHQRDVLARKNAYGLAAKYYPWEPLLGLDYHMGMHMDIPMLHRDHQRYGKTYQAQTFLAKSAISSIATANVRAVNTAKEFGVEPMRLPGMEHFCGSGFLTTDGDIWQHSRKLLKPGFSKNNIVDFAYLSQQMDRFLGHLPADGATVDLQPLFYTMFLNTSIYFLLGIDPTKDEEEAPHSSADFIMAFHNALYYTMLRIVLGRVWSILPQKKYHDACRTGHEYLDHYISRALHQNDGKVKKQSLLSSLATQTDDQRFIRHQILQGMMASQETTSALLGNACLLLSRHPRYWEQVRLETYGLDAQGLNFDALLGLVTVRNILLETLRLYPIFPILGRSALQDTELPTGGGPKQDLPIFVPKDTVIVLSYFALHRDSTVFGEDVEQFRPERWETIKPNAWEFMGFGGGNRACMGQQKALVEAAYVLVRLTNKYTKCESRDASAWEGEVKLTCKSKHGCKVALLS